MDTKMMTTSKHLEVHSQWEQQFCEAIGLGQQLHFQSFPAHMNVGHNISTDTLSPYTIVFALYPSLVFQ
jgi:hypothetical protein